MPKSKREKKVTLSKTQSKGRARKESLVDEVRGCADSFKAAYVINAQNMRNTALKEVRQQLATMLFDNAEMRKQLNAYTEGILMQTMERLDQLGAHDKDAAKQLTAGVTGATDMVSGLLKGPKDQKV